MIKLFRLLFMFLVSWGSSFSQAPLWQWVNPASSSGIELAHDVTVDPLSGNIYACGTFDGNLVAVFGGGFLSAGLKDGFVAKYTPAGSLIWSFRIGGLADDEIKSIACDQSGNFFITGYFKGTVDFNPSILGVNLLSASGINTRDGFLAKYNSSGAFLWAVKFGNTANEEGNKVWAQGSDVFITGYYESAATFYSTNNVSRFTAAVQAQANFFGAKYNTLGEAQWVVSGGSGAADVGFDLVADDNAVFFTGNYASTFFIYNGLGVSSGSLLAQTPNKPNIFVCAVTQSGSVSWITNASSGDDDLGFGITADSARLYIAGGFKNGTLSFPYPSPSYTLANKGGYDIYIASLLKSNGVYQWVSAQAGSSSADELAHQIEEDVNGNLVVTGTYRDTLRLAPYGGQNFLSAGNEDVFVSLFDNQGNFIYSIPAGGTNFDVPHGLATSSTGAVYVGGEYANSASFGSFSLLNFPGKNVFVAKTGCESISNNTIAASQTICSGFSPQAFVGSSPAGAPSFTYAWQFSYSGTSWTMAPGTATGQSYAAPSLSTTTLFRRMTSASGNCLYPSNVLTLTVHQPPSQATVSASQTVCATTTTLAGNNPLVGSGLWSVVNGQGSLTSASSFSTGVNGLSAGANSFVWTITNGVCPASSATVVITRDLPPDPANAGNNQTVCATSFTLSANSPSVGTGLWSLVSGSASLISVNSASSAISNLAVGANVFQWTSSNGVCPTSVSSVTITRDDFPSVAAAGSSQTVCASTTSLAANNPLVGSGLWSVASGQATLSSVSAFSTTVNGLSAGANSFVWTISNGVCPPSSATVMVTRDLPPDQANAGNSQTVCATSLTLSANSPIVGTGLWSLVSGSGNLAAVNSASSAISNLGVGPNVFQWTINNGVCPASASSVTITRDDFPSVAAAGSNQTVCASTTSLNANNPVVGSGLWSVTSGQASLTSASSFSTDVNGLSAGANSFVWSVSNGVCPASSATVVITRDLPPDQANAGNNQTVCATSFTLAANSPSIGTGLWSLVSGSGSIISVNSGSTVISNLGVGVNVFQWATSNGICPASVSTVTITRDDFPDAALAGADQLICSTSATLSANSATTGTGQWSLLSGAAFFSAPLNPQTQVSGLGLGMNVFAWTISNGVCPPSTDTVSVTRDGFPDAAVAGVSQTLCGASAQLNANIPQTGNGYWTVLLPGPVVLSPSDALSGVSGLNEGDNQFVWTITNGVCTPSADTVSLYSYALPSQADAGTDQQVCGTTATLQAMLPAKGTGSWQSPVNGNIVNMTSANTVVNAMTDGTHYFIWKVENGICPVSVDSLQMKVFIPPGQAQAGPDQQVCGTSTTVDAEPPLAGEGIWEVIKGNAVIGSAGSAVSGLNNLSEGENELVWKLSNGVCAETRDTIRIISYAVPEPANAGNDLIACAEEIQLKATLKGVGEGKWSVLSGTGVIQQINSPETILSGINSDTIVLRWEVRNGICPVSFDDLIVQRDTLHPVAVAGSDIRTESYTITLSAQAAPGGTWELVEGSAAFDNVADPNSAVSGLSEGRNVLRWTVGNGYCRQASDELIIEVNPFFIPNAISPNNDGYNDTFYITGMNNFEKVRLQIFNRWGQLVYDNPDYRNNWTGTGTNNEVLADDTYYYVLEIPGKSNYTGYVILKRNR